MNSQTDSPPGTKGPGIRIPQDLKVGDNVQWARPACSRGCQALTADRLLPGVIHAITDDKTWAKVGRGGLRWSASWINTSWIKQASRP